MTLILWIFVFTVIAFFAHEYCYGYIQQRQQDYYEGHNRTKHSRDEHMKIHQVLLHSVVTFKILGAVSVVAITESIDKNCNHSKNKYPQNHLSTLILTTKHCARELSDHNNRKVLSHQVLVSKQTIKQNGKAPLKITVKTIKLP